MFEKFALTINCCHSNKETSYIMNRFLVPLLIFFFRVFRFLHSFSFFVNSTYVLSAFCFFLLLLFLDPWISLLFHFIGFFSVLVNERKTGSESRTIKKNLNSSSPVRNLIRSTSSVNSF